MTRFTKSSSGKYIVSGRSYEMLIGTRAQVWHGTAYKTSGGLCKTDLFQNKAGRIVSKAKYLTAKKEKRLIKAGYGTKKGKFGYVKLSMKKGSKKRGGGSSMLTPSTVSLKGGTRRHRGGAQALSPSYYNGKGVGTSGVNLQFVAGNATS
jgi:hypothetical protein